jgi:hypothetical protein
MPNWSANTVKITAKEPNQIPYIKELLNNTDNLFNFIKPCPQQLYETIKGWVADGDEQKKLEEDYKVNLEKYGYTNWYDFCCEEWGTKWDAKEVDIQEEGDDYVVLSFDTAWSPPIGIYEYLVNEKDLDVQASYCEQGVGFMGVFDNGEVIQVDHICRENDDGDTIYDNFNDFFDGIGFSDLTPPHYGG